MHKVLRVGLYPFLSEKEALDAVFTPKKYNKVEMNRIAGEAAKHGHYKVLVKLVEEGLILTGFKSFFRVSASKLDLQKQGISILTLSVFSGSIEIVNYLYKNNVVDVDGDALMTAIIFRKMKLVSHLIEVLKTPYKKELYKRAFVAAFEHKNTEIIEILMKQYFGETERDGLIRLALELDDERLFTLAYDSPVENKNAKYKRTAIVQYFLYVVRKDEFEILHEMYKRGGISIINENFHSVELIVESATLEMLTSLILHGIKWQSLTNECWVNLSTSQPLKYQFLKSLSYDPLINCNQIMSFRKILPYYQDGKDGRITEDDCKTSPTLSNSSWENDEESDIFSTDAISSKSSQSMLKSRL